MTPSGTVIQPNTQKHGRGGALHTPPRPRPTREVEHGHFTDFRELVRVVVARKRAGGSRAQRYALLTALVVDQRNVLVAAIAAAAALVGLEGWADANGFERGARTQLAIARQHRDDAR